ncbi:amidohydrolase [Candidatus Desulforudis audaxviator]|uniref:Amidohydrolase n=1 Tax=Desulforudis audaxviator (strain MP104C) TaxID=477974 RepID=B1I674_DESAP|nr:amidohydrolase [Candidatus Desulforudis audaxviator]ACA60511.1 amidohydrolase [Candidatus Desulforudis audaxviator MP104C]AZK60581.1 amidohydrolase [Candidatus Desulforudis audaxviator]
MLAITNGRILTMAGRDIPSGTVLIEGGLIKAVGAGIGVPDGAEVLEAAGKLVLPGLIEPHCHVGIMEEIFREEGNDGNEYSDPVTPQLRAIDGVYPEDLGFTDALAGGVTTLCTTPGSANVIGGEMVILKTAGKTVEQMLVRFPAGLKAALGENPKRAYGKERKAPVTRMASAALLRTALVQGAEYIRKLERAGRGDGDPPDRDLKLEALARVLRREIPLRVHAHRADDILTAVRIAREFNLDLVIEHGTEADRVADMLVQEDIPVVLGPLLVNRPKVEMRHKSLETAARLAEAGVRFAVMTDHPAVPVQYLGLSAALTVRGGLSEERALRAVTADAAAVLGLADRLGTLEPGKEADVVIMDGDFFDVRSRVERVYIKGRLVYTADR